MTRSRLGFAILMLAGVGLIGVALGGCISAEDDGGAEPMCESTDDCDPGEVCDEGVCWGNPPADARFAAVMFPPLERPDLSFAIVDSLDIAGDGTVSGLEFPEAVTIRGRVLLACPEQEEVMYTCGDGASVGAQITVERAPPFAGGPALSSTVVALPDIGPGQDAFAIRLPRDPDTEIRITITPDDTAGGEEISPGELAPPRQISLVADGDMAVDWVIGDPAELKVIHGVVQNSLGEPYTGMQVTALGRWTELSPLTRASSRSLTGEDGSFALSVPIGMLDEFDIVVTPAPGVTLPTLRLMQEFVRDPEKGELGVIHEIDPLVMPNAPNPTTFQLPVEATATAGGQERVPGAAVRFTTILPLPDTETRDIEVTYTAQAVTSGVDAAEPGVAEVELYPGGDENRVYQVSVIPPPDSPYHSAFDLEIAVGLGGAEVLQAVALARRVAITGSAFSHEGEALADAPIKATPSSQLEIEADNASVGGILDQLQFPTDTTDEMGAFLMWLDREVAGAPASYDVEVNPPFLSGAPAWTFELIDVPTTGESVDLGELELPRASYARGIVHDQAGEPVAGAEVHFYQLPESDYCLRVLGLGAEDDCEPPAHLRGISPSDDTGWVHMALPDP